MMEEINYWAQNFENCRLFGDYDLVIADHLRKICNPSNQLFVTERVAFCLCTKGEAVLTLNAKSLKVQKNDLVLFVPKASVSNQECSSDFDISVLVFSKFFAHKDVYRKALPLPDMINFVAKHPMIHLSDDEASYFLNSRKLIEQSVDLTDNRFRDEILHGLVSALLQWLSGLISNSIKSEPVVLKRNDELVARFLRLVSQEYREHHQLDFYANSLCVSTKYLSTVSKQVTNHSAGKLITYVIISEAKRLLLESHLTVSQIALDLGFPNQSCFGKYFKKETGQSPSQFRLSV